MSKPDPFAALDGGGAGRLSLPFLPTLVTALVLGAGSLLCREPAPATPVAPVPAAPAPAASVAPRAFHAAVPAEAALPRPPAAIAFAQFPPSLVLPDVRTAALPLPLPLPSPLPSLLPHPAARVATAGTLRRACTAPRCAEGPPRRPDPFSEAVRPAPVEAEAQMRDGLLPDLALPFAPAVRVVGEAAAYVRTGATALGGSVAGSVAGLVDRLN